MNTQEKQDRHEVSRFLSTSIDINGESFLIREMTNGQRTTLWYTIRRRHSEEELLSTDMGQALLHFGIDRPDTIDQDDVISRLRNSGDPRQDELADWIASSTKELTYF